MGRAHTMIFRVDVDAKQPDAVRALTTKAGHRHRGLGPDVREPQAL
jgi:hypothetical protein